MAFAQATLEVRPFKVHVADEALAECELLLRLSKVGRATIQNTTAADPTFGVSRDWTKQARDHWLSNYDWRKTEARVNSFDSFKAGVSDEDGVEYDIHFIALQSKKKDSVPVVFLHGWPGSFFEFLSLIDLARTKYTPEELPYTFIVPSLPGYGFSAGPSLQKEWTLESMAYIVDKLAVGLGFGSGYIAQGGDIGSFVGRILAAHYPACKALHINFALMPPPEGVKPEDVDAVELRGLERAGAFGAQGDAYAREQGQRPATIGLVLSTSPLALLVWIGEKFLEWVDEPLSLDQILDNVSLYWLTETFPRAIYPYRQFYGPTPSTPTYYVEKPMGYSWFPKEIAPIPRAWVSTTGNLVWYKQHTAGGHFAALERPQDLLQDVEEFVAAVWK